MDEEEAINCILKKIENNLMKAVGGKPGHIADRIITFKVKPGDIDRALNTIRPVCDSILDSIKRNLL